MENTEIPIIKIQRSLLDQMMRGFRDKNAEQGCLIGSSRYLNRIDRFAPVPGIADQEHFIPDMDAVNDQIARWQREGVCFCGFIHSHPTGAGFLSHADCLAIEKWVRAANLPFLCFGLLYGGENLELHLAYVESDGNVAVTTMTRDANLEEPGYVHWRNKYEQLFCR